MKKYSILIIGSGAREHAIGWKLSMSSSVGKIFFAPGNGGTSSIGENIDIQAHEVSKLLLWARRKDIDLVVVGPETSLEKGVVDMFQKNKIKIFGPIKKAAKLEYSKSWAIKCMKKYSIPHPESHTFYDAKKAINFIDTSGWSGWVIKADGLAAGKGVILCKNIQVAKNTVKNILLNKIFGSAGNKIIIQEILVGKEMSLLAFCDGKKAIPLIPAQDHKKVFDYDKGPNTGGMGAFAPVPGVSNEDIEIINKIFLQKMIDGLRSDGIVFRGVLYAGLMITKDGPKVLEYNTRLGDPETQPLMMLLHSDLYKIFSLCITGSLNKKDVKYRKGCCVCVVLSSKGYPSKFKVGEDIKGLKNDFGQNIAIFYAGTKSRDKKMVTSGGRVLSVCGYGSDLEAARKNAYKAIGKDGVWFDNMHYRKDIGRK